MDNYLIQWFQSLSSYFAEYLGMDKSYSNLWRPIFCSFISLQNKISQSLTPSPSDPKISQLLLLNSQMPMEQFTRMASRNILPWKKKYIIFPRKVNTCERTNCPRGSLSWIQQGVISQGECNCKYVVYLTGVYFYLFVRPVQYILIANSYRQCHCHSSNMSSRCMCVWLANKSIPFCPRI